MVKHRGKIPDRKLKKLQPNKPPTIRIRMALPMKVEPPPKAEPPPRKQPINAPIHFTPEQWENNQALITRAKEAFKNSEETFEFILPNLPIHEGDPLPTNIQMGEAGTLFYTLIDRDLRNRGWVKYQITATPAKTRYQLHYKKSPQGEAPHGSPSQ